MVRVRPPFKPMHTYNLTDDNNPSLRFLLFHQYSSDEKKQDGKNVDKSISKRSNES